MANQQPHTLPSVVHREVDQNLNDDASVTVYRIVQEALTNVTGHAEAYQVKVELALDVQGMQLKITDDGQRHGGHASRAYRFWTFGYTRAGRQFGWSLGHHQQVWPWRELGHTHTNRVFVIRVLKKYRVRL
jgi:hypothetical protein